MHKVFTAKYPSNIALVKYWGKYGNQLPRNASLSMTLCKAYTEVSLICIKKKNPEVKIEYFFEGSTGPAFYERILRYIIGQNEFEKLVRNYTLKISSKNSFPHSAGIASSASAFAAIAAVLLKASNTIRAGQFNEQASRLARLGSGSACRSFYGPFSLWGKLEGVKDSSDEYAIPVENVHKVFKSMMDAILIVDDSPKKVSSSKGHSLMKEHPYAAARFRDANKNCKEMLSVLRSGDFENFAFITEREALSLHAMMMTSREHYLLIRSGTVKVIEEILRFRKETGLPLCYTLDAGPNVHLLYPASIREQVHTFIQQDLFNDLKTVIYDSAGSGGTVLKVNNGKA